MNRPKTYATKEQAQAALTEWRLRHAGQEKYSIAPFEDTLRSYLHSLEPGREMDEIEAAWDWAIDGFKGKPAAGLLLGLFA